jgi:crotonobetainyl-CoA:carnitine CoA-transferase CaiB-like acyl-CoA transferase
VYDVSMFDSLVSLMTTNLTLAANGGSLDTLGQDPGYGFYPAADGGWLALGIAFEDHFWRRLCGALDLPSFADLDGAARVERRPELRAAVGAVLASRPLPEWESVLTAAGVPFGPVVTPERLLSDPHLRGRGLLPEVDGQAYVRQPLSVDGTRPGPLTGCASVGEHTVEVLADAGLDAGSIDRLLTSGAAFAPPLKVA